MFSSIMIKPMKELLMLGFLTMQWLRRDKTWFLNFVTPSCVLSRFPPSFHSALYSESHVHLFLDFLIYEQISSFWPDHTEAKILVFSCTFLLLSTWLCSWFTHGKDTKDKITHFTLWTNGPGSNLYWTLSWSENQTFLVFSLIVSPFYLCHYVKKVLRLFQ